MLDIALIRQKPDWVKEQIKKLNDEGAIARIDSIVTLDQERRETRTRIETAQAARNKLNRAMGKLRGNKSMNDEEKAARAQAACGAIGVAEYDRASGLMDGSADVTAVEEVDLKSAFDELIRELRLMGDEINEGFDRIESVEAELRENMLWLPNLPHDSVPVAESEESNLAHQSVGRLPRVRFRAQAALGAGTGAGHHRLRARRQAIGQPLLCADGLGRRACNAR